MDAEGTHPGCSSPPGGIHCPQDAENILQIQTLASLRSLSLRERGTSEILQGGCRQRAYARDYRRDTIVRVPDKSSPAPASRIIKSLIRSSLTSNSPSWLNGLLLHTIVSNSSRWQPKREASISESILDCFLSFCFFV